MNENRHSSDHSVEELLREAGRRTPIPASDLAAIRASARREWASMVGDEASQPSSRALRWPLALAAVLAIAVLAGWWWRQRAVAPIATAVGTVEVSGDPAWTVGSDVAAGTVIESAAPLAIRLHAGQSLRLAAETSLELTSATQLHLGRGAAYVDSGAVVAAEGIVIVTRYGVVREVGTQFEVRVSSSDRPLRVRVREGEVVLSTNGDTRSARVGEELALQQDGSVERQSIDLFGEAWEWVESIAPPFVLDESSLASYLEWLARETGWRIELESPELEQAAGEIILYGSLEGLAPRETVEVALPMSGLEYELDGGRLRIRAD